MTPAEADALATQLGNPTHDPHGDPIPTAAGVMEADTGRPLAALEMELKFFRVLGGDATLSKVFIPK